MTVGQLTQNDAAIKYNRMLDIAEERGVPVSEIQAEERAREIGSDLGLKQDAITKATAEEAKARAKREAAELELRQTAQEWTSLNKQRDDYLRQIQHSEWLHNCMLDGVDSYKATIEVIYRRKHHMPGYNENPAGLREIATGLLACEKAVELYPAVRAKIDADLAKVNEKLIAFAKLHKITEKLPEDLRAVIGD